MERHSQRHGAFCIGEHRPTDIWSPSKSWTNMKLHFWAIRCLISTFDFQNPLQLVLTSLFLKFWAFTSIDQADLYYAGGIIKQRGCATVWKQNVIQSSQLRRIFVIWDICTVTKLRFPLGPSEAAGYSWRNTLSVDVVKVMTMFHTTSVHSLFLRHWDVGNLVEFAVGAVWCLTRCVFPKQHQKKLTMYFGAIWEAQRKRQNHSNVQYLDNSVLPHSFPFISSSYEGTSLANSSDTVHPLVTLLNRRFRWQKRWCGP